MPNLLSPVRSSARLLVATLALAAGGCASRVVDVTEPLQSPRHAATEEPDDEAEHRARPLAEPAVGRWGDPRQMRTADGRPAPYGRDPDTGRAINDLLQPARSMPPPRMAAALPPPASVGARPAVAVAPQAPARGAGASVVVAKGDTLHSLARRHNIRVDDIKRVNGLTNDQIKVGQRLALPGA